VGSGRGGFSDGDGSGEEDVVSFDDIEPLGAGAEFEFDFGGIFR